MDLAQVRRCLTGCTLAALGLVGLPAGARSQQPAAAPASAPAPAQTGIDTTSLLDYAATHARKVAARLDSVAVAQSGRRAPADPSNTQYQNGLVQLLSGQCEAAYLLFRAAVASNGNSARNHGDLAYSLACRGRLDDAAAEYAVAIQKQGSNPWYYVGLADVRAQQQRWTEASANYSLALATDSTILTEDLVDSATAVFQESGSADELLAWSRRGTQLFPNDAMPWLRVAMMLRQRGDTTPEDMNAIRHFHALQPENKLGDAYLALYLQNAGQPDSALAYAALAASDSSLREAASMVYLRIGAHMLQNRDFERAAQVLHQGRDLALPANHARYSLYLAHANIQRAVPIFQEAVSKRNCAQGRQVDSILVEVDHDLHESMALDSLQSTHILNDILPQFKSKVDEFKGQCR